MSSAMPARVRETLPSHGEQGRQRPLRAVDASPQRRTRPRLSYAITTLAAVSTIVVAQLLSSVALSQGAYELSSLRAAHRDLGLEQQSLEEQIGVLGSPQYVTENAQELGMVIDQSPAYLRLSDGKVLGDPGPGGEATERPMEKGNVANSQIGQYPLVTDKKAQDKKAQDKEASGDSSSKGESDAKESRSPVTSENGLPTPNTH